MNRYEREVNARRHAATKSTYPAASTAKVLLQANIQNASAASFQRSLGGSNERYVSRPTKLDLPILPMMQTGADFDGTIREPIVDSVRKSPRQNASKISVRDRSHLWHGDEQIEHAPEFVSEVTTQSRALAFVPA